MREVFSGKRIASGWSTMLSMHRGHVDHAESYRGLGAGIDAAIAFLKTCDVATRPDGKHLVNADGVFVIVQRYATKSEAAAVWETHRKHVDVQYIGQGRERMGWCRRTPALTIRQPYCDDREAEFYEPPTDAAFIELEAGEFAVFWPDDVHAPSLTPLGDAQPRDVLKVVVKVPVELVRSKQACTLRGA